MGDAQIKRWMHQGNLGNNMAGGHLLLVLSLIVVNVEVAQLIDVAILVAGDDTQPEKGDANEMQDS